MKVIIDGAIAHPNMPKAKTASEKMKGCRRPTVSERREKMGWNAVEVNRKAVDSQDAELDDLKYEVIAG